MKEFNILISGKVQGVFFRAFVKEHAIKLSINGWVINTNNCVEVFAQGSQDLLNKLIIMCKQGPIASNVLDIQVKESEIKKKYKEFKIIL